MGQPGLEPRAHLGCQHLRPRLNPVLHNAHSRSRAVLQKERPEDQAQPKQWLPGGAALQEKDWTGREHGSDKVSGTCDSAEPGRPHLLRKSVLVREEGRHEPTCVTGAEGKRQSSCRKEWGRLQSVSWKQPSISHGKVLPVPQSPCRWAQPSPPGKHPGQSSQP